MIQLIRYGIVGVVSNGLLYLVYIALTFMYVIPEVAATIAYVLGVCWTYFFNRNWSFESRAAHRKAAPRYALTYLAGYFITIGILAAGYRWMGMQHFISQLIAIGAAAIVIFLLLRFWVFANAKPSELLD